MEDTIVIDSLEKELAFSASIRMLACETIIITLCDLSYESERKSALEWFNAREQTLFGYGWCLVQTGYNPSIIRKLINDLIQNPTKNTMYGKPIKKSKVLNEKI